MNNKIFKFVLILSLLFSSISLNAFSVKRNAYYNKEIFGIEFPNGGSFYAAANLVSGVSMQKYVLGAFEVTEVVIDIATSSNQLTIYAAELLSTKTTNFNQAQMASVVSKGEDYMSTIAGKASGYLPNTDNVVVKEYPATTHSKTMEYKVTLSELEEFYSTFSTDFTKTSSDDDSDDSSESSTSVSKTSIKASRYIFE